MSANLFAYGTLANADVMRCVAGRAEGGAPAVLAAHRRRVLVGRIYPAVVPAPGESVDGVVWHGLTPDEIARLDRFEGELYERVDCSVVAAGRPLRAQLYRLRSEHEALLGSEPFRLADFEARHLTAYLEGCRRFRAADGD